MDTQELFRATRSFERTWAETGAEVRRTDFGVIVRHLAYPRIYMANLAWVERLPAGGIEAVLASLDAAFRGTPVQHRNVMFDDAQVAFENQEAFVALGFLTTKHLLAAFRDARRLAAHLREGRYDLVDAHGSQDLWTCVAARALLRGGPPLVFTRHNTKVVRAHPLNRWLYRRGIDHLIVASGSVLDRYRAFLDRGDLTTDRCSVVHSAYRTDRFRPNLDGSRLRAEIGAGPLTPIVGVRLSM